MRVLILVLCFFVLVLGSFANAQVKEMKLSGCVSKKLRTVDRIYNQNIGDARIFIANKASNTIVEINEFGGRINSYTYKLLNINSGYAEGIQNEETRAVKDPPNLKEWIILKLYYDNEEADQEFHFKDLKSGTTRVEKFEYVCNSKKSN